MTSTIHALRHRLKSVLPRFIIIFLRNAEIYTRRIWYWVHVMREVKGRTVKDKAKLWQSFCAAPLSALRRLDKWQNPVLYWDTSVRVPGVGQFEVRTRCDDLIHVAPIREPAIFE